MSAVADLERQLTAATKALIDRIRSAVPPSDSVLVDLYEQWAGALMLANKYANDERAVAAAAVLLKQLLAALQSRGVESF